MSQNPSTGGSEHRQRPRVAHAFMVRYRLESPLVSDWLVSPLRDLSSSGARFLSEQPFKAGQFIELQLLLPFAHEPLALRARVAWTKPARLGMLEIGVTFEVGDPAVQRVIDTGVAHLLQKQQRG
jgi:Tfp pilus assembly protein PilZ